MALAETPEPASAGAVGRLQDSDRLRGAIGPEDNSAPLKNQARNGLIGLRVMAPSRCPRCHGTAAVIGAPKGPHAAALMCICGRHLGWISSDTFNFISVLASLSAANRLSCVNSNVTRPSRCQRVTQPPSHRPKD